MKRIISYVIFTSIIFVLSITNVFAYSYQITSKSIVVGESVTLTIDASDNTGKFDISSSDTSVVTVSNGSGVWIEKEKATFKITAKKRGKANITITPTDVSTNDGKEVKNSQVIAITVVAKPTSNTTTTKPKSSNNNLISLTIDGYELDKTFSKDTLEYNVEIKPEDEKINVNAQTTDSTAKVTGTGEITLNPGSNKIEIKVTAQNGNVKTYVINATLKEYKNIEVDIDNKKYTIVRKEGLIDTIEGYEKTTIKIEDEDVLAYHNEKTKYDLVILKDEDDNYNYYVYKDNKYTLYKEYDFSGTKLFIMDKELDKNKKNTLISSEFKIGEDKIKAYQIDKSKKNQTYALDEKKLSNYYLVYAMNINTGNEGYYLIDNKENTAIRYSDEMSSFFMDTVTQNSEDAKYKNYFFIALGVFGFTILIIGICSLVKSRKNRRKHNL